MLKTFAIELFNEVADECELRAFSLNESEEKRELLSLAAIIITEFVEEIVESAEK